jgi:putative endonuclease
MPYFVYVIQCNDGSFYTGYTKNVDSRMRLHVNGTGARYTRIHKPKRVVHVEKFDSRAEAMRRERTVKRLCHDEKVRLARTRVKAR